jgi:AcrR family transcriptional regulator
MSAEKEPVVGRMDRRRQRTRSALIAAAQQLLAQGRSNASIQEITDAADVGFGSFYNHFESKDELFEAAIRATLEAYDVLREELVGGYDDPAEVFAISFRMTGRLQRQAPELVRVVLHTGAAILQSDVGLGPSARRDIVAAQEAGRFEQGNPDLALMSAGGALLGLLQLLDFDPDADADELSDEMTYHVLRMFGMTRAAARKLCSGPLPGQPQI